MIEKPNRKKQRKNEKRSSQNPINKSSFTSENPIRILMPILEDGGIFHLTGATCPPTHRNASGKKKMTKPTYPNQKIQLLHTS